nr:MULTISPECIES: adaptor protein MecA [Lactobacillaceae]
MEHINENTIRVILSTEDLSERGVSMLDLLGNKDQIETFFYSILDEVDEDHTFTNNQPVTFQIMPNKEGLEVLIVKANPDDEDASFENINLENFESKDMSAFSNASLDSEDYDADVTPYVRDRDTPTKSLVVEFNNFEDFIQLSKILRLESGISNLWQYNDKYYLQLIIFTDEIHDMTYNDIVALLSEYSSQTKTTSAMLSEYGKELMSRTALEQARYYFD